MFSQFLEAFGLPGTLFFALLAAFLSVLAYLPYLRDTLAGSTRPHRASWFIWSVLASISFWSLLYEGAGVSLFFTGAQAGCTSVIFLLSLKCGQGRWITKADGLVLCAASVGLVAWALTDTAIYALALSITISLMGGSLTVLKAYRTPRSETLATWGMSFLASCAAIAAVQAWDPLRLAYPLYLFALNGAIVLAVLAGRRAALVERFATVTVPSAPRRTGLFGLAPAPQSTLSHLPMPPQQRANPRFDRAA